MIPLVEEEASRHATYILKPYVRNSTMPIKYALETYMGPCTYLNHT
jgi:hypothetical protein